MSAIKGSIMKYGFTKVLVLKPQVKLLVLINSQLPSLDWQKVANSNFDLTAYHIGDVSDDDGLWSALTANHQQIFQQELAKLIGSDTAKQLKLSLLDFLSCFKFEWHDDAQIISKGIFKTTKQAVIKQDEFDVKISKNKYVCLADICEALEKSDLQSEQILPVIHMVKLTFTQKFLLAYQEFVESISEGVASVYAKTAGAIS